VATVSIFLSPSRFFSGINCDSRLEIIRRNCLEVIKVIMPCHYSPDSSRKLILPLPDF
jgi:hypothetical protein